MSFDGGDQTNPNSLLKRIRVAAGLSMREMARMLGQKHASGYQYHESPTGFQGPHISHKLIARLEAAIEGGRFPLTREQVCDVAGFNIFASYPQLVAPSQSQAVDQAKTLRGALQTICALRIDPTAAISGQHILAMVQIIAKEALQAAPSIQEGTK